MSHVPRKHCLLIEGTTLVITAEGEDINGFTDETEVFNLLLS